MYSKIYSGAALGIDGIVISVESDISAGLPGFTLVGYLSSSVKEAGERVRTALKNSDIVIPAKRITVNLSPADFRKEGTGYDLAIALSILASMQVIPIDEQLNHTLVLGELGLNGDILGIPGVLPMVHYAAKNGFTRVLVPAENAAEAALIEQVSVIGVRHLKEVISYLNHEITLPETKYQKERLEQAEWECEFDMKDLKGQKTMKRGMEIAVSGFHNILLTGAAGAGKSLIAKCLPGIMPRLSYEECIEMTKIYSVAGSLNANQAMLQRRSFRSPHHTISEHALIGGGPVPKPGEVSLAHHSVLFLDEFPEFKKSVIEALRQPMEDRQVTISRVRASYTYPADFMLVAAMNPCPCGYYPDRSRCRCTEGQIAAYQGKISGPIMDRIDISIAVKPVAYQELFDLAGEESSATIRQRVEAVRQKQLRRYQKESFQFNSQLPQKKIPEYIQLDSGGEALLKEAFEWQKMSARGMFRVMRLARTVADVNEHENVQEEDVAEAIFFQNGNQTGEEIRI
jgi:magnesium chelatase family protein